MPGAVGAKTGDAVILNQLCRRGPDHALSATMQIGQKDNSAQQTTKRQADDQKRHTDDLACKENGKSKAAHNWDQNVHCTRQTGQCQPR